MNFHFAHYFFSRLSRILSISRLTSFPAFLASLAFLALLLFPLFSPSIALAGDAPFIGPSNSGFTGLMETPTARVMRENSYRIGFGQVEPYRYYYGAVSPLKGLEFNLRITEIIDVSAFDPDTGGNYRDKAVDVKVPVSPGR